MQDFAALVVRVNVTIPDVKSEQPKVLKITKGIELN